MKTRELTINGTVKTFDSLTQMLTELMNSGMLKDKTMKEVGHEYFKEYNLAYIYKMKKALVAKGVKDDIKKDGDEKEVKVKVKAHTDTKKVEVKKVVGELHHEKFQTILKCLTVKRNVMMVGAAGSGKTTCAQKASETLNLAFFAMSVGAQTSKSDFMGFMNANGNYVKTHFRDAYENGGVFLIDEIDAGNSGIMTIINAALANTLCAFPDKMVEKHQDFICCAAANTFGKGADRMYVGRNQLDAATLDRFVKINFDYDEKLEAKLATNDDWFQIIRSIRRVIDDKKLRILATPRATFNGCALLETGMNFWEVLELTVFNGITKDEMEILVSNANINKSELKNKVAC